VVACGVAAIGVGSAGGVYAAIAASSALQEQQGSSVINATVMMDASSVVDNASGACLCLRIPGIRLWSGRVAHGTQGPSTSQLRRDCAS
jgi:hypothetical protein